MCSTASAAVSTAPPSAARTALGGRRSTWAAPCAALGGLPTPMRTRRKSDECRCDCRERSPLWPARPPPALSRTVPGGRSSSSCTTTIDAGSSIAEPPGQRRARRGRTRSCRSSGRPGATCRSPSDQATRACRPFSALRARRPRGQQLDGVGRRRCAGSRRTRSRVAQPDDQQVGRGAPALRPGEGAAQGLALFGAASAASPRLAAAASPPRLRLALGRLLLDDDARRLADGDGRLGVDVGRDAGRQVEVRDPQLAPMVSALMSTSIEVECRPAAR